MAHIHGWNFSHIYGRYSEDENLPWDFRIVINKYLKNVLMCVLSPFTGMVIPSGG